MARPINPDTQYNVGTHISGGYCYASSHRRRIDPQTGKADYRHVHWGRFDQVTKRFHPNMNFLALPPDEKKKFRFPETWDLSEIEEMSGLRKSGRPSQQRTGDKLYGHIWLLEQVADQIGVREDLEKAFSGNREMVDIVLTLAIAAFLSNRSYRRLQSWQEIVRTPTDKILTPSVITKITQKVTPYERNQFFKYRKERISKGALCAVDSTTRAAYGDKLSEVKLGKSKDRPDLEQTVESVVYSLSDHQPIYYRTFPGNIPDTRTFETIYNELKKAGFTNLTLITDRGYESLKNIELVIRDGTNTLLTATSVSRQFVSQHIKKYSNFNTKPDGMELDANNKIYYKQYTEEYTIKLKNGAEKKANNFYVNIYFDINRRASEVLEQDLEISREENILISHINENRDIAEPNDFKKHIKYFDIEFDEKNLIKNYTKKDSKIKKEQQNFGFFAIMTIGLNYTAQQALDIYAKRDEQEKYFNLMKSYFGASTQKNSSEDGKIGKEFIYFVGLILTSYIKYKWKNTELRELFKASIDIYDAMESIRIIEEEGKMPRITPFVGNQLKICEILELQVPAGCEPGYESQRVKVKRGRKPKVST